MMADLKICRICLRTEAKVYRYNRHQLKYYYEEVMALKVNDKDGLPHYFCYECAILLHKFHKFKEKCYSGQITLKEISWREPITYEAVYKIDRNSKNLTSSLQIMTVTKRVKTYTAKDNSDNQRIENIVINDDVKPFDDLDDDQDMDNNPVEDPIDDPVDENYDTEEPSEEIDLKSIKEEQKQDLEKVNQVKEFLKGFYDEAIENDNVSSPKTMFVDDNSRVIEIVSEEIKERKKKRRDVSNLYAKAKPHRKVCRVLDSKDWKKVNLSENEAVAEFRLRAEDRKYLAAAFKCTDCFKGFSKKDMLNRHIKLRHEESLGNYECRFCKMRFKWDCYLRKHMRQHFAKYECLRCDLVCHLESTAMLHDEYHAGIIRKCLHCDQEFRHMSTYYTHLRSHRSDYVCTICGDSFVSSAGLHQHKRVKHVTNEIESPDDDEDVNTYCERCDIRFETRKAYEGHLFHSAMHCDGVEDEIEADVTLPRKVLGKKMQERITKDLRKRKSDDNSTDGEIKRRRFKRKMKRLKRKPTTCHQCGKHFDTQAACMRHHLSEHPRTSFCPPNERHICEICGASLAPGSVNTHQNMHSREKLHTCDTCGRQFHSSAGLKRHLVTHTGEKPFACSLCDKRFTQSNSMKLHYNTFHLRQPYPKRNRRKKKDEPQDSAETAQTVTEDDSEESGHEHEVDSMSNPKPVDITLPPVQENVHYLTLS